MTVINPKSISGITSITTGSGGDDLLTIHNNSGAERFRVDGSGNTRITSGIVTTLSVEAITGNIKIDDRILHTGDTNTMIRFPANDTVSVETAGVQRFTVDAAGRVLVGGTSEYTAYSDSKIQVATNDSTAAVQVTRWSNDGSSPYLNLGKSRGAVGAYTIVQNGDRLGQISFTGADGTDMTSHAASIAAYVDGTPGSNDMPGRIVFATSSDGGISETERVRINSVGKVGINSTAPDGMLAIEHTSSAPNLTMRNHPAAGPYTNEYGLELRHAYGSVKHGALIHTQEADLGRRSLDISDSDGVFCTFVMGRVGINTTRPTGNLDIRAKTDDNPSIRIYRPSGGGDVGSLAFASSQGTNAYINWRGGGGTKGLQFFTSTSGNDGSTTEKVRITEDLNILDGNLVIGTSGHGIDFSATSDGSGTTTSELLSDYEEGTFTPLLGGSNYGTYNVTGVGKYTKIGRVVNYQVQFINKDMDNSAAGHARIRGWPFAFSTSNNNRAIASSMMSHNVSYPATSDEHIVYCWYDSTDGISRYGMRMNDGAPWSAWDISNFHQSTMYYELTGSYMTS